MEALVFPMLFKAVQLMATNRQRAGHCHHKLHYPIRASTSDYTETMIYYTLWRSRVYRHCEYMPCLLLFSSPFNKLLLLSFHWCIFLAKFLLLFLIDTSGWHRCLLWLLSLRKLKALPVYRARTFLRYDMVHESLDFDSQVPLQDMIFSTVFRALQLIFPFRFLQAPSTNYVYACTWNRLVWIVCTLFIFKREFTCWNR